MSMETLTDSIEAYYEVFHEVTARFGIPIRKEDVLEPMATGSLIWDRIIPENVPGRDEKIRKLMEVIPQAYQESLPAREALYRVSVPSEEIERRGNQAWGGDFF